MGWPEMLDAAEAANTYTNDFAPKKGLKIDRLPEKRLMNTPLPSNKGRAERVAFIEGARWVLEQMVSFRAKHSDIGGEAARVAAQLYPEFDPPPEPTKVRKGGMK